jgi:protein TonB
VHIVSEIDQGLHAPTKIPKDIKMIKEDAPPPTSAGVAGMSGMGSGGAGGVAGMANLGLATPPPVVQRAAPKPVGPQRVSSGVISGMLLNKVDPVYPPIAKAAHVQGVVVLQATISKTGTIEDLKVLSGPPMLTGAAVDAVRRWRYKPYLLSGEPTEVETTINVNFTFTGG